MIPAFNFLHANFKLNETSYDEASLKEHAQFLVEKGKSYQQSIGNFLIDWLDENETIVVKTSGSTGKPKHIELEKYAMVNSALATGTFFNLQPNNSALLCLPANYIAGKMMLVRAMVLGLHIDCIEPTTQPEFNTKKQYDFCAMIPLQLQNTKTRIDNIKQLIVGGAAVSSNLQAEIQNISTHVYETYGMTETITHIAVKKINNFESLRGDTTKQFVNKSENVTSSGVEKSHFKTLPNIAISQDSRDCLIIEAPKLTSEKIITNDVVKLHSKTEFEWLGRYDNVINSGGLKLFPEVIEAKLQQKIENRFFIASQPDELLGNKIILIIEGDVFIKDDSIFGSLDKHEIPKAVFLINQFAETTTGKVNRIKTLENL